MNSLDKQYKELLKNILDNGEWSNNRTGIRTKYINGAMIKVDLREGFPISTLSKRGYKYVAAELECFIHGMTDKRDFQKRKCYIWDEWANPKKVPYGHSDEIYEKLKAEPDLGKIYGYNWVSFEGNNKIVKVDRKTVEPNKDRVFPVFTIIMYRAEGPFYSNSGHKFWIGASYNKDDHRLCNIQFDHTGTILKDIRYDAAKDGRVEDPYEPFYAGVGYKGDIGNIEKFKHVYNDDIYNKLYKAWTHMLDRCYNPKCKEYKYYGKKGIFVESSWHDLSNFLHDAPLLPNFPMLLRDKDNFELDKDYFGSNAYSKDTCVWLTASDSVLYRSSKPFYAIDMAGNKTVYISQTKAKEDLKAIKVSAVLNGKKKSSNNYKFESIDDDKLYRYQLPVNQLKTIIDIARKDPTSRRLICSAWHPGLIDEMSLTPCVFSWQLMLNPDNKMADLIYYQRSCDTALGVPADIESYSMLLILLAAELGYTPRYVSAMMANTHIYENHIEGVKEILARESFDLPKIKLSKFTSIFDFEYTDFELENYISGDKINFDVAV